MHNPSLYRHPGMVALFRAAQRESRMQMTAALTILAMGIALGWLFFQKHAVLAIIALSLLLLGLYWMYSAIRIWRLESHPLFQLLHRQPHRIVWVYTVNLAVMPFGINMINRGDIHIRLDDGSEIVVSLPARQLKLVSTTLSRLLPGVAFGYTAEREQQYLEDPAGLRAP